MNDDVLLPVPLQIASVPAEKLALLQGDQRLTYGELNSRADRLAEHLLSTGLQYEGTVAICLERSFEWVIATLAVMRAGGAYVPVDLAWPDERLNYVLQDAGVSHVIAGSRVLERLSTEAKILDPSVEAASVEGKSEGTTFKVTPDQLAYVIYTSGSTGVPKGVEITHANLSSLVAWHRAEFAITSDDRASQLAGLAFDAAGWEVWPYLACGASVALAGDQERTLPELLQRWLMANGVTVAFVPTVLAPRLCELAWPPVAALRLLLTGGDALHSRPPAGLPFLLVNNYGPTECTVVATSGVVDPASAKPVTIGHAIRGARVYLLDENGSAVAEGEAGELYIGGPGVGRGYRNLPDLTEASFVPDPFSVIPGARMYRTGDHAVQIEGGEFIFRGRADTQDKIRGQRVELEEISSVLNRHPKVEAAVVAAVHNTTDEKVLVAYVVPVPGGVLTSIELQRFLAVSLPAFMVPATFVGLKALPLTPNGKIDRNALGAAKGELLAANPGRAARSPIEARLLGMVRELLQTDDVGVEDDFFLVGGHSLLGTQLVLRVRAAFAVELSLRHLFEAATTERLAVKVEQLIVAQIEAMTDEEAMQQMGAIA